MTYQINRSPKRRRISLVVHPTGDVEVRVPPRVPPKTIDQFVDAHSEWIHSQQQKLAARPQSPKLQYQSGDKFHYLGRQVQLHLKPAPRWRWYLRDAIYWLEGPNLAPEKVKVKLNTFLKEQAREILEDRVSLFKNRVGHEPQSIKLNDAKTRWGSCSSAKRLNFSWRLIGAPLAVIDYVVIHELCHLVHMNHSSAFWGLVASIDPDYKISKKWLKENGGLLRPISVES